MGLNYTASQGLEKMAGEAVREKKRGQAPKRRLLGRSIGPKGKGKRSIGRKRLSATKPVTAVIVAMNHEKSIAGVLKEVRRLPLKETIVIINGSSDRTFKKARKNSDGIIVSLPEPLTMEQIRLLGARLARTDRLVILHSDLPVTAETLAAVTAVSESPNIAAPTGEILDNSLLSVNEAVTNTSIIIPTYNGKELLAGCIRSIREHTGVPHQIIVVDNGSTDGTAEFCLQEKVLLISLPQNEGYPRACNLGMKAADGKNLLLLNNDVVVTKNWLDRLLACLQSDAKTGIVGPMTNYATGKQKVPSVPYRGLEGMQRFAEQWNHPDPRRWLQVNRIVGLCFLMRRTVVETIGWLDERFSPGYYEDDDYCHRARLAGYRVMLAGDVFVHHYGSRSFGRGNSRKRLLLKKNRRKFIGKWGFDPLLLRRRRGRPIV
ncbi:glycosyltransferase family 2 protein [Ferviditalea candida]|uniref:Glycosyltransferase n=1 Tax=Ferviditalea candida TaxID=3108399 RepID=A0ABU5ZD65_9BACL|nr:glycosyltransferase [Paenibacillaceae bacterium T2]